MAKSISLLIAMLLAGSVTADQISRPPQRRAPNSHRVSTIENNSSCDIGTYPAATLLLPYFEVNVNKPGEKAANTIFTVVNTARQPQIARVTLWTDYGYPVVWFNLYLTGYDAESLSLYDVIALGRIPRTSSRAAVGERSSASNSALFGVENCDTPGSEIEAGALRELQTMLTRGVASASGCKVGNEHPIAVGYGTIDVVNSCTSISPLDPAYYSQVLLYDNVLTGDYDRVNPDPAAGNYAGGNPLVHIRAVPEGGKAGATAFTSLPYTFYDRFTPGAARHVDRRQPLPAIFSARFIEGGTSDFATDYAIWREGGERAVASCGTVASSATMPYGSIVRFDEMENAVSSATAASARPLALPASSAASTASSPFPPQIAYSVSGWMFMNLDNRAANASAINPFSSNRASQNWVVIHMRAEGRFAVDFDASMLMNGCSAQSTAEVK